MAVFKICWINLSSQKRPNWLVSDDVETTAPTPAFGLKSKQESSKKLTETCPTCDCICPNTEIPKFFLGDPVTDDGSKNPKSDVSTAWTPGPAVAPENNNDHLLQRTFDDSKIFGTIESLCLLNIDW